MDKGLILKCLHIVEEHNLILVSMMP